MGITKHRFREETQNTEERGSSEKYHRKPHTKLADKLKEYLAKLIQYSKV